jgi:hypothetical protein
LKVTPQLFLQSGHLISIGTEIIFRTKLSCEAVYLLCLVPVCRHRLVMCMAVLFHICLTSLENWCQRLSWAAEMIRIPIPPFYRRRIFLDKTLGTSGLNSRSLVVVWRTPYYYSLLIKFSVLFEIAAVPQFVSGYRGVFQTPFEISIIFLSPFSPQHFA